MTIKTLTPRQIRERAVYEAEKEARAVTPPEIQVAASFTSFTPLGIGGISYHTDPPTRSKLPETAADRRNYYRKQAGWPVLRGKS